MNGNCSTMTDQELETTFFGQGKHQQMRAIEICDGCPITDLCTKQAEGMAVVKNGKVVAGAWGVFGGKAYRDGKIIR